jgi:NADPH:quinone reductase
MRALQFRAFGDPAAELTLVDLPNPQPRPGWAVVRIRAASVNRSDAKNVEGQMEGTVLPRVPGRDCSGVVEAGPPDWIGAEVWGTGGDTGFTLDGSHAELIAIPEAALSHEPSRLDHAQAASIGVTFVVGWMGLADYAGIKKREAVAIVGISGGLEVPSRSSPEPSGMSSASTGIRRLRARPPPPELRPMSPPMGRPQRQSRGRRVGMARTSSSMRSAAGWSKRPSAAWPTRGA